jgi:hypothetical protein
MGVDGSSPFSRIVPDFSNHSFPSVTGGTETQSLVFLLRASSAAGGEIFIFFYIVEHDHPACEFELP